MTEHEAKQAVEQANEFMADFLENEDREQLKSKIEQWLSKYESKTENLKNLND